MKSSAHKAVAIVGMGAVLPDAPNASTFWQNIKTGRYSITEVHTERWDPDLYYDPDPKVPDKTYSKIGGWVREFEWDPLKWKLPIPPRVSAAMDLAQKWAVVATREALNDFGFPQRPLDNERTAVIIGNALGGDMHLLTSARILFPEFATELEKAPSFAELPPKIQETILQELQRGVGKHFPEITEDTMPGELSNIIAGRIAALYNFRGPNYTTDAACASAMAAINAAVEGLNENDFDTVITGGVDANMSSSSFVKFCKIGALSATGSRPYAAGADGFVMGEGAAVFILKRLADAERDRDKIYAVIRGLGSSSDGKGKGITAPNPIGQFLAVQRAWHNAGLSPATCTMIEGHGTSTVVGDLVEVQSLIEAFSNYSLTPGMIALGSVKSNIGHLKGAAGAAGILKATFALHEKVLPPSVNFDRPNPDIDFSHSPFYVNTKLQPWEATRDGIRRAGVSAFGFGGTNFHAVLEEYIPGRIKDETKTSVFMSEVKSTPAKMTAKSPLRGAVVIGADSDAELIKRLEVIHQNAEQGQAPAIAPPSEADLRAPVRLAIDYGNAAELAKKSGKALRALRENNAGLWKALRAQGAYLGRGPAGKVAFLYTGQGSQYVNMLREMKEKEPIVADTLAEAERVMRSSFGMSLMEYMYVDETNPEALARAEDGLRQTAITQPAVLAIEVGLTRLLAAYGMMPDMVMGHSLGEYGALVAAGVLSFPEALQAVSMRGTEMTKVSVADNGMMAAVFGPLHEVEEILKRVEGYVVVANINSESQSVIGGATAAMQKAIAILKEAGYVVRPLPVSHAFHTKIVAPASASLARVLQQLNLQPPGIPIVSNVTGEFYPMGMGPGVVPQMIDLLSQQLASPVQFVKGLHTLYAAGARIFVEVGPKKTLHGFVEDVLLKHGDISALFTNFPTIGDAASFNHALCGLYAAGLGVGVEQRAEGKVQSAERMEQKTSEQVASGRLQVESALAKGEPVVRSSELKTIPITPDHQRPATISSPAALGTDRYLQLGHLFAEFLDRGFQIYSGGRSARAADYVCITGAALGLPGTERVFDDANLERILRGEQFIDVVPMRLRRAMADKNIVRLVKTKEGDGRFETITSPAEVIKLAARRNKFDLGSEYGYPADRLPALDIVTALAIAVGIDALRDAGIPLVMCYKTTTKNTKLPDRWALPEDMRDDTGVIFASAFPGYDSFADIISGYYKDRIRRERLEELISLRERALQLNSGNGTIEEIDRRIELLRSEIEKEPYHFDRRFLFRVLSMGHSQFAEYIGARGPNTQINGACASTAQAIAIAQDWIQSGRCRRVIIVTADDVTSDNLMEWFGAGFVASGAAATDENVEDAATPFDRRRHGLIIGMGAAALVVESPESARERGIQPICDVLSSITANSAFHGSRLDVNHICQVMEKLISDAEAQWGLDRYQIAPQTVFVSHETYTPARGGSASAEVYALRSVFRTAADQIIIANTKGYTGHPMAVGIEDVLAVKILETCIVPPVANFKEVDPELGPLNLSKGGVYPVQYALRLGAGFGSQISMALMRWVPTPDGKHRNPMQLGYHYRITDQNVWTNWLRRVTGYQAPELEVVNRTLRVKDQGPTEQVAPAVAVAPQPVAVAPAAVEARVGEREVPKPTPPATIPAEEKVVAPHAPAAATAAELDPVKERVLQLISEKTGYPIEMLDLDLDLEADLGIDTVKQAEVFAAIRSEYDIPRDDSLKLRDFPTLAHTIKFVYERRPDLRKQGASEQMAVEQPAPIPAAPEFDPVKERILQLISEKTGYPIEMLDLDLDLEADLGIDTVKQAEV
ncbi:MAG: acyltransferase domain-containing protein, partial [candidate division KSB1 bacterium]|nr:acyltransferase domain-containing protein [candidate division KSB1 bacterium]